MILRYMVNKNVSRGLVIHYCDVEGRVYQASGLGDNVSGFEDLWYVDLREALDTKPVK